MNSQRNTDISGIPHFDEPVSRMTTRKNSSVGNNINDDEEERLEKLKAERLIREAEEEQERKWTFEYKDQVELQEIKRPIPKTTKSLFAVKIPAPLMNLPRRSTVTACNYKSREVQLQQDVATPTISSRPL